MPRLLTVGEILVTWSKRADRYVAREDSYLGQIFDRLTPVPDPIVVMVGPHGTYGGKSPWEGTDPATGRRYVARKSKTTDSVVLQEVVNL